MGEIAALGAKITKMHVGNVLGRFLGGNRGARQGFSQFVLKWCFLWIFGASRGSAGEIGGSKMGGLGGSNIPSRGS